MITVYGIPNCNSVKKALDWLQQKGIDYTFHDFKKKGVDAAKLQQWTTELGVAKLVNTKGTTWRGLSEAEKAAAATEAGALQLMQEKTSVIKRPLIERDGKAIAIGFDESSYALVLG